MTTRPTDDDEALMTSRQVREHYGGVSDMWLYRKLKDPSLDFPRPIVIAKRNYWRRGDIRKWPHA